MPAAARRCSPPAVRLAPTMPPSSCVARLTRRALREAAGDVLVFLPGAREIRRVRELLESAEDAGELRSGVQVLPLYGELTAAEQDAALAPAAAGARKVVLATNIAETSLTHPRGARGGRFGTRAPRALRSGDRHGAPGDRAHLARVGRAAPRACRTPRTGRVLPRLERRRTGVARTVYAA